MIKIPPISKIYEAYSCIADKRIEMKDNEAIVVSSDNKKTYTIKWNGNDYSSNDNATFWQGYPGYPVIAVLMLQNKLNFNKAIIKYFGNINWHSLNEEYKRDYDAAIEHVLNSLDFDQEIIENETRKTYEELENLPINIKRKI